MAFTDEGHLKLRNNQYTDDPRPLQEGCPCVACRHSRAYIRHLFMAHEMLGPILLTAHNLTYYQRLLAAARNAIETNCFDEFYESKRRIWFGQQNEDDDPRHAPCRDTT